MSILPQVRVSLAWQFVVYLLFMLAYPGFLFFLSGMYSFVFIEQVPYDVCVNELI
jgi:hypothetical protein